MAIYSEEEDPNVTMWNKQNIKKEEEEVDVIQFLEYEEALTKDRQTASRIRNLLIKLKVWDGTKSR